MPVFEVLIQQTAIMNFLLDKCSENMVKLMRTYHEHHQNVVSSKRLSVTIKTIHVKQKPRETQAKSDHGQIMVSFNKTWPKTMFYQVDHELGTMLVHGVSFYHVLSNGIMVFD